MTPTQAIILAAGVGSRLASRPSGIPKCLVPVAGVPILHRQLAALRTRGVNHVVVVTGYERALVEQAARAAGDDLHISFVDNPSFATTNVLASWFLGSGQLSDTHYYMHGDTVFEPDLLARVREPVGCDIVLTVDRHPCGDEEMKVRSVGDRVEHISKQLDPATVLGEFTGVLLMTAGVIPTVRSLARDLLDTPKGSRLFFEAALQTGIDSGRLNVGWSDVTGMRWREIDFPEDLDAADAILSSG
jgi:L-glutamine-phosphate cytidylyltransferase